MKTVIQGDDSHRLLLARLGHYGLLAHPAPWGENLVEVLDAMHTVGRVDRERYAVQAFAADDAAETLGVVGFACGTQNSVQNGFLAHATLLQSVL